MPTRGPANSPLPQFPGAPFASSVLRDANVGEEVLQVPVSGTNSGSSFKLLQLHATSDTDRRQRRADGPAFFAIDTNGRVTVAFPLAGAPKTITLGVVVDNGVVHASTIVTVKVFENLCNPNPCKNAGQCSMVGSVAVCSCQAAFGCGCCDGSATDCFGDSSPCKEQSDESTQGATGNQETDNSSGGASPGAAIGGVVGGLIVITLMLLVAVRRQRNQTNARHLAPLLGKQDRAFNRTVYFHHLRFLQPLLTASDRTLLNIYRLLGVQAPSEDQLFAKRLHLQDTLTTSVSGNAPDKAITAMVDLFHDGMIDAMFEELLDRAAGQPPVYEDVSQVTRVNKYEDPDHGPVGTYADVTYHDDAIYEHINGDLGRTSRGDVLPAYQGQLPASDYATNSSDITYEQLLGKRSSSPATAVPEPTIYATLRRPEDRHQRSPMPSFSQPSADAARRNTEPVYAHLDADDVHLYSHASARRQPDTIYEHALASQPDAPVYAHASARRLTQTSPVYSYAAADQRPGRASYAYAAAGQRPSEAIYSFAAADQRPSEVDAYLADTDAVYSYAASGQRSSEVTYDMAAATDHTAEQQHQYQQQWRLARRWNANYNGLARQVDPAEEEEQLYDTLRLSAMSHASHGLRESILSRSTLGLRESLFAPARQHKASVTYDALHPDNEADASSSADDFQAIYDRDGELRQVLSTDGRRLSVEQEMDAVYTLARRESSAVRRESTNAACRRRSTAARTAKVSVASLPGVPDGEDDNLVVMDMALMQKLGIGKHHT